MNEMHRLLFLSTLAVLVAGGAVAAEPAAPRGAAPLGAAMPAEEVFNPGVGDMMNSIIQPHHAKLGLALREQNWPLAFYLVRQLRQGFDSIARVHPKWRNMSIDEMIDTVTSKPLRDLEEAIKGRNGERFAAAYGDLTEACNSCHAAVNYSFIVIQAPEQSAFPNQDFRAVK
jgi:hypothetical protein